MIRILALLTIPPNARASGANQLSKKKKNWKYVGGIAVGAGVVGVLCGLALDYLRPTNPSNTLEATHNILHKKTRLFFYEE